MGAGALTVCHNKAAVQVKEDMKKIAQLPILRPWAAEAKGNRLFGVSLLELHELGLVEDGVPLVVRRMVEHLRKHALHQEGLFRVNGNVRVVETLKQRLESGEDVDFLSEADVCTVASLLKQYLRDLPEGLVHSSVKAALIQQHQEWSESSCWSDLGDLLHQLPDIHYSLLRYLCHFLTEVESHHKENRMTAFNLATVFGPNVFHVAPGFEAMQDQNVCNKIIARLIQNYSSIFESDVDRRDYVEELPTLLIVKEAHVTDSDTKESPSTPISKGPTPIPRKKVGHNGSPDDADPFPKFSSKNPTARPRKKKMRKGTSDSVLQLIPQPSSSAGLPRVRPLPIPILETLTPQRRSPSPEKMTTTPSAQSLAYQDLPRSNFSCFPPDFSPSVSVDALNSSKEEERPISPFYMSTHLSPIHCRPDVANFLDRTIRSAVEQHLFDVNPMGDQSLEDSELSPCPPVMPTARQRRRHRREQQEEGRTRHQSSRAAALRADIDKEDIPSIGRASISTVDLPGEDTDTQPSRSKHSPTLAQTTDIQESHALTECLGMSSTCERPEENGMESIEKWRNNSTEDGLPPPQALRMKIQESHVTCDTGRACSSVVRGSDLECEEVPQLDLTALTDDSNWGESRFFSTPFLDFKSIFKQMYCDEPVPANSSWQRESMDREEARLSPHAGGRLIRQLLEEDSDPMLSPRFYAYGHCQQYLDDTEVPPSPPNAHSFVSRRRSSSLGSCDEEKEELTSAQLSKRIHVLKKKIRKFEEKFEDERKYRPSHSDKVANPEVLRWVNELARLRKDLKEHKLLKSEEDLPPVTRQRSNTLPKSFGSQLEKKPAQEKAPLPPVETTLEVVLNKLQEKRNDLGRPEDIKDMTREQIGAEKVALQKALLYYESIHGRPVTKSERQIMKPLYDRYRLVKQILCRASTIPVIGSPSSKRRGPLLQPIIEGEPALFFDDIKEEEDGSEDDAESKTEFTVSVRPDLNVLGFLDQLEEDMDGFISPVDELSPSRNTTDMRLSNLHSATTQELVEQLQETREEKKRIRKNLREFEDQFFRQNGRNVQKEDRSPLAVEYNEYKHVKAKLRLLEVLISKRDSTKFL